MITLLTGENDFLTRQKLAELTKEATDVERFNGEVLSAENLADITGGTTLFSDKRTIVIKDLSANSALWNEAPSFFERLGTDTTLFLVESNVDKRTKTYRWLQEHATVTENQPWSTRDRGRAETWARAQAKALGVKLEPTQLSRIIDRTGLDAGRIHAALEKLALANNISDEIIDQTVEKTSSESVFELFETALSGKKDNIGRLVKALSLETDAYQVVGVLAGQSLQLAALALGGKSSNDTAIATGFHPFGLSKLSRYARKIGPKKARQIVHDVAATDARIKTTTGDPWASVEALLYKIAETSAV